MNQKATARPSLLTVFIINGEQEKLTTNSEIFASLNQISMSISEASEIIAWVQQSQPDLLILNLELTQIINLQLIAALRLDWLTRTIPIMIITNPDQKFQHRAKLDYDVCLIKPYSTVKLEKAICSLLPMPACEVYLKAV